MYDTAILLVSSFFAFGISQDPCVVNQLINEPRRSPSYVPGIGEGLICDRVLADGWYRFSDNGMMPEKCIDRYRCGTHDPIWFMGKHPTKQGQEVTGKACANTGFGANCCGYEVGDIRVKHCGTFFVYRLSRVQGCSFAYCAGKGDPCPFGTSSPTGYQPGCVASFPTMAGNPILLGPVISGFCPDGKRYTDFYFTCRVNYLNPYDANVAFEIKWLIDSKPLNVSKYISGFVREASIHVSELQKLMDHELSCAVRSNYPSSPGEKSPFYTSTDHYRMEIKFDPGMVELDEKARTQTEIKVVSTVPIPCADCSDRESECIYSLHLHAKNLTSECNITLSYKDWNDTRKSAVATTYIEADKDFFNDNKTGYLQPVSYTSTGVNPILNSYIPPPLQVLTKNSPASVCICSGDPHCLTFDRNNAGLAKASWKDEGYYNMYHVGMFTMVQTKAVPPNIPEFKVEIQTQTCWEVTCICGVVAREGTDVVSLNTCDFRFGGSILNEQILFPAQFSNLTLIHEDGKSYMIYFPSGRWVKVYKTNPNITNVEVQARPDDADNVEGLCGEFNGHPEVLGYDGNGKPVTYTRTPDSFIESNRIPIGSSMTEQRNITYSTPANSTRLCDCIQDIKGWHVDCTPDKGLVQQIGTFNITQPNYIDLTQPILNRSKALGKKDAHYPLSQYNKDKAFVPVQGTWPTKGGLYEADVRRICQDAVNNLDALRKCKLAANIDFGGIIETCVEDIKITSDITLAQGVIHIAMSMCVNAVVKNPVLFHQGKSQTLGFLRNRPCLGDCTGHGNCTQGKCICNFGFDGKQCSVDTTKPPVLEKIYSVNPCDLQQGPCGPIYMSVSNFYLSPNSRCHLRELKFSNDTFVETGYGFYTPTEHVAADSILCLIPAKSDVQGKSIEAYAVSITSDGNRYSQSKTFTIYNSTCMTCDANSICTIKAQTCMIGGTCWAANETKHDDQTYSCDPQVNNTEWTHRDHVPTRADIWTRIQTGCVCSFDTSQIDCACCEQGAVQCPFGTHHQCVQFGSLSSCGTLMPAPMFGIDGYTRSLTGCSCDHDRTVHDCACCQNGGVQCGSRFRNQCVQNGHIDQCGQKQHIFGSDKSKEEQGQMPTRADIWTRIQTGCVCSFDTSQIDCACCEQKAVQCPFGTHHQCVQSWSLSSCIMPAPMFGIDGYMSSFSGCLCNHDKTVYDCACCQNGGVQCGSHFRNQCVQNGHIDQCRQKQHIFGP